MKIDDFFDEKILINNKMIIIIQMLLLELQKQCLSAEMKNCKNLKSTGTE